MPTAVIFPDVELWASGYLRTALAANGYPGMHVGNKRGEHTTAVWVRRDGGPAQQVTEDARMGVNVFAATDDEAGNLARVVSALMRAAAGSGSVRRVRQTLGPSPIPDAASPRRYMTFELVLRGTNL